MIGVAVVLFFRETVASLLLADSYRSASSLMPWIAIGYWLLLLSQVYARVCYAYHDTRAVLAIETVGAVSSIAITMPAIHYLGLAGAAAAIPCYFGVQLGLSAWFARRSARRESTLLVPEKA